MAISTKVRTYLDDQQVSYDTLAHDRTATSLKTAEEAHVPGSHLVKGVIVKDGSQHLMALLPASHHLRLGVLQELLGQDVVLAREEEFTPLFEDCDEGAVPALGMAYGLEVVVDDSLSEAGDLYFEGGDHATLVHIQSEAFEGLVGKARHGHFSRYDKHPEDRGGFRFSHS